MPGWRLEKTRAGVARGIQFLLSASPLVLRPLPLPCVSCTRVNRQPNLDVSSRPRLPVGFSPAPGPASIYIALRGPGSLESCVEGTDPLLPFAPLAVVATALVYRAMVQVRSKVTGAGKVVSLFTFRSNVDDEI